MNERSSLAFLAHLLLKQPPGPQLTLHPHTVLLVQFPLPGPSLCWISLPPPYSRATCSLCRGGEEAALSHCFCQECSVKAHWPPSGQQAGGGGVVEGSTWNWVSPSRWCEFSPVPSACSGVEDHLLPGTRGGFGECLLPAFCSAPSAPPPAAHREAESLGEAVEHCALDFWPAKGKNETKKCLGICLGIC